ncbi:MAG TPA: class I SAM-dependent methyltransferase [Burkholderiales bacterium]|nr:class I SAM-dependent methyltransferase [Burkholderiales bacterium]
MGAHQPSAPSPWVLRWAPLVTRGPLLDVACGGGRHARLFAEHGIEVVAVDREPQSIPGARFVQADLEEGDWPFPNQRFGAIIVTNYLHRPLLPILSTSLLPDGILLYETFMLGNERYGKPSNPRFLLHPGELWRAFGANLHLLAFEQGRVAHPKAAVIQRLCATREP